MEELYKNIDATINPAYGCTPVSPGCDHCYAVRTAGRLGKLTEGTHKDGKWTGKINLFPEKMEQVLRRHAPLRIIVGSMTDLFHPGIPDEFLDRMFAYMALAHQHTFMLLTKRPKRMREYISGQDRAVSISNIIRIIEAGRLKEVSAPERVVPVKGWPGYFVTSKGRVLSDRSNSGLRSAIDLHELTPQFGEQGHARVMLQVKGEKSRPLIHRLVLEHFDRMPIGSEQACHLTGDARNNALWNLKWGSQSDNWKDSKRHGTARRHSKLSPEKVETIRSRLNAGESAYSISKDIGISDTQIRNISAGVQWKDDGKLKWPIPAVWLGVTAESQEQADARIPILLDTPASNRFVSVEPMLGPVIVSKYLLPQSDIPRLEWVICGGETGPESRPAYPGLVRSLRDQCVDAKVPFFFKSWGDWTFANGEMRRVGKRRSGREIDGQTWDQTPEDTNEKK